MNNLKQVSRSQYIAAVKEAGDTVRPQYAEGYSLSVVQRLGVESARVRFQAIYSHGSTEEGRAFPAIDIYYIEDV